MSSGDSSNGRRPWFEIDPGRRVLELRHVQEIDPQATDEVDQGELAINAHVTHKGVPVSIHIDFPADYPAIPPTIYGPLGLIERHQQPVHGNFCLIDNEEHWWKPYFHSGMLMEELQRLLDADEKGVVAEGERDMPEPISAQIYKRPGMVVLLFEEALTLELGNTSGTFELARRRDEQWVLTKLVAGDGSVLAEIPDDLYRRLGVGHQGRAEGNWTSVDRELAAGDVRTIADLASDGMTRARPTHRARSRQRDLVWSAVTFPEQAPTRKELRRAWLFYATKHGPAGGVGDPGDAIRTQAVSSSVRRDRLLELQGLENQRFLVVGAGAIGGQLVLELAKAGIGDIDVVDSDIYDVGNAVRHPLGLDSAGLSKADEVAALAERFNPFSRVRSHHQSFGHTPAGRALADELVHAADVVIDTTGFHSVTRLLHQRCAAEGMPLVSSALSVGGYGGRIVVLHRARPCFDCFLDDRRIPAPAQGEAPNRVPYGCSHAAASCAGFDVLELVANTARTAIRLVPGIAYPSLDFDWAVLNFRPGFDRWTQGQLLAQADCPMCA